MKSGVYGIGLKFLAVIVLLFAGMLSGFEIQAGELALVKGDVWVISPDGTKHKAEQGEIITSEEIIETGANSKAVIKMEDGSEIELGSSTRIQINDPSVEARSSLFLFLGRVFAKIIPQKSEEPVFTIESISCVAGVRGTEFDMAVGMDGSALVSVEEGEVELSGEAGPLNLFSGEEAELTPEGKWQKRKRIKRTEKDWQSWFQARQQFFIKNSERVINRLVRRTVILQSQIQRHDLLLRNKQKKLKTLYEQGRLPYEKARRIARRQIRTYLRMLSALAKADSQLRAINFIIWKAEQEIKQHPSAYSDEFKKSIADARRKLNQIGIKELHRKNRRMIRTHLLLVIRTAKKYNLEAELWRNLPPKVRKRILEKAQKKT